MSLAAVVLSKEETFQAIADLRRAAENNGGEISNVKQAVDVLTTKFRDHARAIELAQEVRPSGTDTEAFERYTIDAELVQDRMAGNGLQVQYAEPGQNQPGREYAGHKDAPKAIRLFSEWDEMGNREPGLLDDPQPVTAWQARLQDLLERRSQARVFLARTNSRGQVQMGVSPKIDAAIKRHIDRGPKWVKQVFADNAGEGGEFVPDVVMPDLERKLELPRNLIGTLQTAMIPTGGTTRNPFLITGCQPFIYPMPASGDLDPADIQRSVPETTDITHSPKTWGVVLPANRDATEDSIIEWGPFGSMLLAEAIRDGEEDAMVNADLNGGDTGLADWDIRGRWPTLGNNNDHRKSFNGLRAHSFDVSSSGAITTESALGVVAEFINLDSPHMVGDLIIGVSPEWMVLKLLTDTNLITVDKMGDRATLLTGQVGSIAGHPVVMSEFIDKEYNASGIYDHVTRTKTGVLIYHRGRWVKAVRRGPRVEVEVVARQHTTYLTLTERWTLKHRGRSTEKSVTWQYNASTS
jgi:hypothetical protein